MSLRSLQVCDKTQQNRPPHIKPIWEVDRYFKCPVIGTCFRIEELKKILKKSGICTRHLNAYQIHKAVMQMMGNENEVSRKVDISLKHRFRADLSEFANLEESEFVAEWKYHFEKGQITGLLWIAAVRSDLSGECLEHVFGDIHMLSHENVNDGCTLRQHLSGQQDANSSLAEKVKEARSLTRRFKKERNSLESDLNKLGRAYETLKREKEQIHKRLSDSEQNRLVLDLQAENSRLLAMAKKYEEKMRNYVHKLAFLEDENTRLVSDLERQQGLSSQLTNEVAKMVDQLPSLNQCDEQCPAFDLCAKRVLIVGGITKMQAYYRDLIEQKGGIFEYHDGYMNGGKRGLEGQVKRSDIVLCPVNCNSHGGCLSVKKLCQKHNKPVQMLSGASLSAISQAISRNIERN